MPPAIHHHRWFWKPLRWLTRPLRSTYAFLFPSLNRERLERRSRATGIPFRKLEIAAWPDQLLYSDAVYEDGPCHVIEVTHYSLPNQSELPPHAPAADQHPLDGNAPHRQAHEFIVLQVLDTYGGTHDIQLDCGPAGEVSARRTTTFHKSFWETLKELLANFNPPCDPASEGALVAESLRFKPSGPTTHTALGTPPPSPTVIDLALLASLVAKELPQGTVVPKSVWYAQTVFECARKLWPAGTYKQGPGFNCMERTHSSLNGQTADQQKTVIVAMYDERRAQLELQSPVAVAQQLRARSAAMEAARAALAADAAALQAEAAAMEAERAALAAEAAALKAAREALQAREAAVKLALASKLTADNASLNFEVVGVDELA